MLFALEFVVTLALSCGRCLHTSCLCCGLLFSPPGSDRVTAKFLEKSKADSMKCNIATLIPAVLAEAVERHCSPTADFAVR